VHLGRAEKRRGDDPSLSASSSLYLRCASSALRRIEQCTLFHLGLLLIILSFASLAGASAELSTEYAHQSNRGDMAGFCLLLPPRLHEISWMYARGPDKPGSEGVDVGARARTGDQQGQLLQGIPLPRPPLSPKGEPKEVTVCKDKVGEEHRGRRVVFACCIGEVQAFLEMTFIEGQNISALYPCTFM